MSFRDLPRTLAAIEDAFTDPPSQPWTTAYVLCARPRCINLTLRWLSPYCAPDCARQVAAWLRNPHLAEFPAVELTATEQALRERLAHLARLCRTQLADVREADELLPDTLDDQDRAAIAYVTSALAQVPAEVARLKAARRADAEPSAAVDNRQTAFALQPSSTELAAVEEQTANQVNRPWSHLPATPWDDPAVLDAVIAQERQLRERRAAEAAKPRPRPRPPWWRRLARLLATRKARR